MTWAILSVAAGGAVGAVGRYLTGVAALRMLGPGYPWATFAVNVVGSFAMGVLVVVLAERGGMRFAPFLMTGVLGGFTTFSAFSLDVMVLFERGEVWLAAVYAVGSALLAILALAGGMMLARGVI